MARMSVTEGFSKITKLCNKFYTSSTRQQCRPFVVDNKQVGLISPKAFQYLQQYPSVFQIEPPKDNISLETVRMNPALKTYEDRSAKLSVVLDELRNKDVFLSLGGWRDETYDVWHKMSDPPLLKMERTATCLFGTIQYGVHINGFLRHPTKGICMWIGKRSKNKQTWPEKLDQMAAGGLSSGEEILECAKRECQEEASVPDYLLDNLKPAGCVSYFYEDERGLFPEVQFVFDLEVPEDFVPENADGEVQSFQLHPIEDVKKMILKDDFKFNCAAVVLDFLIRHGHVTADDEPDYCQLVEDLHVKLDFQRV